MLKTGKPLYAVIFDELQAQIIEGELNPGDMLPSEKELASQYQTSRMTVRKSLQILEEQALIYSWQGKGYFVASPAHDRFAVHFSDEERGLEVLYRQISAKLPSLEVSAALDLSTSAIVIEVTKIIKKRGAPVALDYKFFPYHKGMPSVEEELNYAVFPDVIASRTPPFSIQTRMEIKAELPNQEVQELLECSTQQPLLVAYRYLSDHSGRFVGYGIKYMMPEYGSLVAKSGYEL
jgi:GntR family transcriptional regulator